MKQPLLFVNGILAATLLCSGWAQRLERRTVQKKDFLRGLSLAYRGWKTTDRPLSRQEEETLDPDAVLMRHFQASNGEFAELTVIAGSRKRSVHTPSYCLPAGGWEIVSQKPDTLPLPGGRLPVVRSTMIDNRGHSILTTYCFTDGSFTSTNLIQFQGYQFLKRLERKAPLGALVRLIVPVTRNRASALDLTDDFARATLPPVMAQLRAVEKSER